MTVLGLACLMVAVGLAFKLSAVPFHFWCPDVFAGASAEIGGFLSVASKAAALALLVRVVVGIRLGADGRRDCPAQHRTASNGLKHAQRLHGGCPLQPDPIGRAGEAVAFVHAAATRRGPADAPPAG